MEKQQQMFSVISLWQQSGLSQKAWCQQNNMAYATFHYWYKRFRDQPTATGETGSGAFVHLTVDGTPTAGWCELVLADGKKLVFHQPVSAPFLSNLIG
jgi:hypothetical protein